jgi:hypothetical protein
VKYLVRLSFLLTIFAVVKPVCAGDVRVPAGVPLATAGSFNVATVSAPGGYNRPKHIETSLQFTDAACLAETINAPVPQDSGGSDSDRALLLSFFQSSLSSFPTWDIDGSRKWEIHVHRYAITFPHHHFW